MKFNNIIVEKSAALAQITINRPKKLNALNKETIAELSEAFTLLEQDADVIIMLHKEGRLNENYPQDLIEVIVRKARHTDEGTVFLRTGLGGYGQISVAEAAMEIERMGMNAPQQTKGKGGF